MKKKISALIPSGIGAFYYNFKKIKIKVSQIFTSTFSAFSRVTAINGA